MIVNGRFLRVQPTGMHRAARNLLQALQDASFPFEVWAPPGIDDPLVDRTIRGLRPGRGADQLWEQSSLAAAAWSRPLFNPINTAPLLHPRSLVWTHDLGPIVGPEWFRGSRAYGFGILAALRRARFVFVPSVAVLEEVVARGVPSDRVAVLRSPVDALFQPSRSATVAAVRERYGLGRPYLLHLGWADPRKDVRTAVAAHLRLAATVPHDLVLAGRQHPVFAPVELADAPSIRRLGYLRDGDLAPLMSGAAAFVFPSLYEGFGLPPLEAMACGTPAIVSDIPVHREATGGLATFVARGDVEGWAEAMEAALAGDLPNPPPPPWTAADLAAQFIDAVPTWAA